MKSLAPLQSNPSLLTTLQPAPRELLLAELTCVSAGTLQADNIGASDASRQSSANTFSSGPAPWISPTG